MTPAEPYAAFTSDTVTPTCGVVPMLVTPTSMVRLAFRHSASFAGSVLSAFVSAASMIRTNFLPSPRLKTSCYVALTGRRVRRHVRRHSP